MTGYDGGRTTMVNTTVPALRSRPDIDGSLLAGGRRAQATPRVWIPEPAWPAWRRLADALGDQLPPCAETPDAWSDPRPSDVEVAVDLCRTSCRALVACRDYARAAGERGGVWGGEVR